jgi:hypothetical protein
MQWECQPFRRKHNRVCPFPHSAQASGMVRAGTVVSALVIGDLGAAPMPGGAVPLLQPVVSS